VHISPPPPSLSPSFTKEYKPIAYSQRFTVLYTGADPAPELTDAYIRPRICRWVRGILPREILKSRTSEMRFPAFWANSFVPIHISESQKFRCIFGKTRKYIAKTTIEERRRKEEKNICLYECNSSSGNKSLLKNSQYCASCSLNFSIEKHFNRTSRQRKYTVTYCVTKVYTVCSTSCIGGLRRQCYYVVYEPPSPINFQ
jgi:hypothetical protein